MFDKNRSTINCTSHGANSGVLGHFATNNLYNFQENELISMKLSVVLETRRAKANGKFTVKIRFNYGGQAYYVTTGVDVPKGNFHLGKIIGLPKANVYNSIIANKLEYTQNVLDDLQLRGLIKTKFKTGSDIKRFIEAGEEGYDNLNRDQRMQLHFKTYVENHATKYKLKSSEQYTLMLKKVEKFCELENLFIDDITIAWLKDFDLFCERSGMNVNGRAFYMRAIRVVWNDAIDRGLVGLDKYPFRRFKIKKSDTKHLNMPLVDFRKLMDMDCTDKLHLERYRDMFMLSFFLCGMNIKDMLFLRKADIIGGEVSIVRVKTNVPIRLKLEPEALAIIERYKGDKFLLNIMENYANHVDFRRRLNRALKQEFPYISIYWARHSWATYAGELDVPDPIIDMGMGHKLKGMSAGYVARNMSKVTEANRKVIDYVLTV
jgi:integrase